MQFVPEVSYFICGGEPLNKWMVAIGLVKAPPDVSKEFLFYVELPSGGMKLQSKVKVTISGADLSWKSANVVWHGTASEVAGEEYDNLAVRGIYDPGKGEGSITFAPCRAFSEIAATSLW